jgi:hypothetical protein
MLDRPWWVCARPGCRELPQCHLTCELGIDVDLDEVIRAVTGGDRPEAIPPELRRALNQVVNVTLATNAGVRMLALMPLVGGVVRAATDSVVLHRVASAAEAYYRAKLRT